MAECIEDKIVNDKYSPEAALAEIAKGEKQFKTSISLRTLYRYIDNGIFLKLTNKDLPIKSKKKKQIKVTFGKVNKADGYQICYAANKKFKKAKKVLVKATDKTIKKLKAKKKYYVRVRAYRKNGSKKLYGAWSSVKKVKVK